VPTGARHAEGSAEVQLSPDDSVPTRPQEISVIRITLAAFALSLAAAAALPATARPAQPAAATAAQGDQAQTKGDPNRRVCKQMVPTGTRLAKGRVCKKAREWQQQRDDDKGTLNRMQKLYDNQAAG
jgi:hypothetical protein